MRVLFWSELYWPYIGGAEIFASKLIKSLRERGVEFLVVTSHHDLQLPDVDRFEGVEVRRLPFRAAIGHRDMKSFIRALKEVEAIKREFSPDIIHINAIGPSVLFHLKTANVCPAPVLVTMQQELLGSQGEGEGTLMSRSLAAADWVVGCSRAVLTQLRAACPSIEQRSSCIYNGVDLPEIEPGPLPEPPRLLCLGRLVPAKGFDVALRAFAGLVTRHPALRLTVAGDGVAREDLQALAKELGIDERVDFLGWVEPHAVPRLMNEASMVIMPSRREGLPVVAVQAALMARPIVATAVGGLPEVVVDGESGILVATEDAGAVAVAVDRILNDRALAMKMGSRAREHARSALFWTRTVIEYHDLYTTLTETSPTHAHFP